MFVHGTLITVDFYSNASHLAPRIATVMKNPSAEFLQAYRMTPEDAVLWQTFLPGTIEKRRQAYENKTRLVHYTSAENAIQIVRNKQIWLRNSQCMNDYSEVQLGITEVIKFFSGDEAKPFWEILERCCPGLPAKAMEQYNNSLSSLRAETYLVSLSEHSKCEDQLGRLSMWRSYGVGTGIAIVLNTEAFHSSSAALKIFSLPVCYATQEAVVGEFKRIVSAVVEMEPLLRELPEERLGWYIWSMLEYFSVGLKHPGFSEEQEWRVVHSPLLYPSDRMKSSVEVIRGVPQTVYKAPLADVPDEGFVGASIPRLINRVIVGPSQFPGVVWKAVHAELVAAGVPDAHDKISVSGIPLR